MQTHEHYRGVGGALGIVTGTSKTVPDTIRNTEGIVNARTGTTTHGKQKGVKYIIKVF